MTELTWEEQPTIKRPQWRLIPPGFPCPTWINDKVGVRRDWFTCFVAARKNVDGSVDCWPIGIANYIWIVKVHSLDNWDLLGKPTAWNARFLVGAKALARVSK